MPLLFVQTTRQSESPPGTFHSAPWSWCINHRHRRKAWQCWGSHQPGRTLCRRLCSDASGFWEVGPLAVQIFCRVLDSCEDRSASERTEYNYKGSLKKILLMGDLSSDNKNYVFFLLFGFDKPNDSVAAFADLFELVVIKHRHYPSFRDFSSSQSLFLNCFLVNKSFFFINITHTLCLKNNVTISLKIHEFSINRNFWNLLAK